MGIPYAEKVLTAMQFAAYMLTGLFTAMGIFEIKYMLTSVFAGIGKKIPLSEASAEM